MINAMKSIRRKYNSYKGETASVVSNIIEREGREILILIVIFICSNQKTIVFDFCIV